MTVKEFNAIGARLYTDIVDHCPEVAELLRDPEGVVYIYDVQDARGHRAILPLTHRTQLNDNALRAVGVDPEHATCKLRLTLNRATKHAVSG